MITLANDFDGQVKICELGSHMAPKTAMQLRVTATPTVIYFRKGREVERVAGFRGSLFHRETISELFDVEPA